MWPFHTHKMTKANSLFIGDYVITNKTPVYVNVEQCDYPVLSHVEEKEVTYKDCSLIINECKKCGKREAHIVAPTEKFPVQVDWADCFIYNFYQKNQTGG